MSKIGVALCLAVLLVGACIFIGNNVGGKAIARGGSIGTAISAVKVNSDGTISITTP